MKTVYADVVLLVNFCADYMLLFLCSRFLHIKVPLFKLLLASVLGALYGFLAVIFPITGYLFLPVMTGMCYVAFGKRRAAVYIKGLFLTFIFSLLLAGMLDFLYSLGVKMKGTLLGVLLVMLGIISVIILTALTSRIFQKQLSTKTVNVRICLKNERLDIVLLADSGNLLTEPVSNKSVIVLDNKYRYVFLKNSRQCELLSFKTVAGNGIIELYKADFIYVNNKTADAFVGFCISGICSFDGYDGIIPGVLVENL